MSKTVKKQIGFYADPDIEMFLDGLEPGVKTRTINAALRAWREGRSAIEGPKTYNNELESLVAWLNGIRPVITVSNQTGEVIAFGGLLERFLNQDKQRDPNKSWSQISAEGVTFEAQAQRCASCNKGLLLSETIHTPSRGPLCRQCFEIPFSVSYPILIPEEADFERYAFNVAESWLRFHKHSAFSEEYSTDEYNELPRYIQKQITSDHYHQIILRCLAYLRKQRDREAHK